MCRRLIRVRKHQALQAKWAQELQTGEQLGLRRPVRRARSTERCPAFPAQGFAELDEARIWATRFVHRYNVDHRHSGIRYCACCSACTRDHANRDAPQGRGVVWGRIAPSGEEESA